MCFDARRQFVSPPLLLNPSLLRLALETLFRLRRSEHCKAHSNVTGHILKPLDLGIAEAAPGRASSSKDVDLLKLE